MARSAFKNEPYNDWKRSANRRKQLAALEKVRSELGREYPLLIGSERVYADQKFQSFNPSRSTEVVGVFQKGDASIAGRAMDLASAKFQEWRYIPAEKRAEYLF